LGWWFFPIWWESHNPVMFQTTSQYHILPLLTMINHYWPSLSH
jgi:hypothetical protein